MIPVSVYIITLNEEANIGRLLDQLSDFQEIIVVDSGSMDNTRGIAGQYANVKIYFREWSGFSAQKAYALSLCRNEWVLNLDADEELTDAYLKDLKAVVSENQVDALQTRRILLRWGKTPRHFRKDDVLIRLFRKTSGHYEPARVHERITVAGKIREASSCLLHHEDLTFSQRMHKSNQYSQLKAEDKFEKGAKASVLVLVLIFPWSFLQCYLFKGHFLDGVEGLLSSMNFAYYNFMKYAKLWELNQGRGVKKV